jgi:hypothetical protein
VRRFSVYAPGYSMASREPSAALAGVTTQQVRAAVVAAGRQRDGAAALCAEHQQAGRRASALVRQANAILDSAVAITEAVLARRRIALAEPVGAEFRADEHGSHGIEITIRLEDPARAPAARRAIIERFRGEARCDRVIVA